MRAVLLAVVSTRAQNEGGKDSIPAQITALQACAEAESWTVIDIIEIPGASRAVAKGVVTWQDFMALCSRKGLEGAERLWQHWQSKDFDVLAVRDTTRFARGMTLFAEVMERTYSAGAKIYSLIDGYISPENRESFTALGSFNTAMQMKQLNVMRQSGFEARRRRGLPANARITDGHKFIRDRNTGKAIGIEIREETRDKWRMVFRLLVEEKLTFSGIASALNDAGYRTLRGMMYSAASLRKTLYAPSLYGHLASDFRYRRYQMGRWIFEPGHPLPSPRGHDKPIRINYYALPPIFNREEIARIMVEMEHRSEVNFGRRTRDTLRFSGLVICGVCGKTCVYSDGRVFCKDEAGRRSHKERVSAKEHKLIAYMNSVIMAALDGHRLITPDNSKEVLQRITQLDAQIAKTENDIAALIMREISEPQSLQHIIQRLKNEAASRLDEMKRQRQRLQNEIPTQASMDAQQFALQTIGENLATFWETTSADEVNAMLRNLLGDYRIVIRGTSVLGLALKNKR